MKHKTHNSIYPVRELVKLQVSLAGVRAWFSDFQ